MKYTNLEGISKRASRLVYGTVQPVYAGSREEAFEALDAAWEAGFRIFDTAHSYGEDAHAEKNFGAWIEARGVQDEVIILDKGFNPGQKGCPDVYSAQMLRDQIEESLQNLRTDCLDIYILHRDDPRYPVDEIVEVLNEYHDKGAILRFGGSNWTYERTLEANRYAKEHGLTGFTVCEPNYSLAVLERDPWGGSESPYSTTLLLQGAICPANLIRGRAFRSTSASQKRPFWNTIPRRTGHASLAYLKWRKKRGSPSLSSASPGCCTRISRSSR